MSGRIISPGSDWTFEIIERYEHEIARIAADYNLDTYPNQLEIISSEQMIDAYSLVGLPVGYSHWSFGKQFLATEQNYRRGHVGLAYEIVINSNPVYLLPYGGEHFDDAGPGDRTRQRLGTIRSSKVTTCFGRGRMPMPLSTIWCLRVIMSPNVSNAMANWKSSCCSIHVMR